MFWSFKNNFAFLQGVFLYHSEHENGKGLRDPISQSGKNQTSQYCRSCKPVQLLCASD